LAADVQQVAKLDQFERLDGLTTEPVPADLGIRLECRLGQPVGEDPLRAHVLEPPAVAPPIASEA
jgi:hypothetical protein